MTAQDYVNNTPYGQQDSSKLGTGMQVGGLAATGLGMGGFYYGAHKYHNTNPMELLSKKNREVKQAELNEAVKNNYESKLKEKGIMEAINKGDFDKDFVRKNVEEQTMNKYKEDMTKKPIDELKSGGYSDESLKGIKKLKTYDLMRRHGMKVGLGGLGVAAAGKLYDTFRNKGEQ